MSKIVTTPNAAATQTENPGRATFRTFVQNALAVVFAVGGAVLFVPGFLDAIADYLGAWGIALPAAVIALPTAFARLMAVPGVEAWFRQHLPWLAAAPKEPKH